MLPPILLVTFVSVWLLSGAYANPCEGTSNGIERVIRVGGVPQWFHKPFPNRDLLAYSRVSPKGNRLLDFSGSQQTDIRFSGTYDAVPSPDGRFIIRNDGVSGSGALAFYPMDKIDVRIRQDRSAADIPPVYRDTRLKGVYWTIGVLDSSEKRSVYRVLTDRKQSRYINLARGLVRDYEVLHHEWGPEFRPLGPVREYCQNLRYGRFDTPMLSKTGRFLSVYDRHSGTSKIYELGDDPTTCTEVLDMGFATGKITFSSDDSQITFHVDFFHSQAGERSWANRGVASNLTKDVMVARLRKHRNGDGTVKALEITEMTRLTTSFRLGSGAYYPDFAKDDRVVYVQDVGNRFEFVVADPRRARFASAGELGLSDNCTDAQRQQHRTLAAIGGMLLSACSEGTPPVFTDAEAVLFTLSLDRSACEELVSTQWGQLQSGAAGRPIRHPVRPGQSPSSIAAQYPGVSPADVMRAAGITDPTKLPVTTLVLHSNGTGGTMPHRLATLMESVTKDDLLAACAGMGAGTDYVRPAGPAVTAPISPHTIAQQTCGSCHDLGFFRNAERNALAIELVTEGDMPPGGGLSGPRKDAILEFLRGLQP